MTPPIKDLPKKSRRPGRVFSLGCGGTAAVLTLALSAYLKWANTLPPPEAAPPRVLPSPNGYHARITATNALVVREDGSVKWQPPWNAKLETLRRVLAKQEAPLNRLRTALRQPCYAPSFELLPEYEWDTDLRYPFLLIWAEARVARADGRYADAMNASLDAVELGVKMGRGGPVQPCLEGQYSTWGVNAGESVIGSLSAAEARKAGDRLDGILRELPTFAEALEAQRLVQLAESRGNLFSAPVAFRVPDWVMFSPRLVSAHYPKSWAYAKLDHHCQKLIEVARLPFPARRFPPSGLEGDPVHSGAHLLRVYDVRLSPEEVSCYFAENEAVLRMLRVRLALQEFRQNYRKWPVTLREAVSSGTVALTDPFSDTPFRYQQKGGGFTLYSVGPDRKDDGGRSLDERTDLVVDKGDLVLGAWLRRRRMEASK